MKISRSLILKAQQTKTDALSFGRDDGNSRVSEYESLLDLFTLISLILIFAAFIYVTNAKNTGQNASDVDAKVAESGTGLPDTLPQDLVLLVLFRENDSDKICILDGATGLREIRSISRENLEPIFKNLSPRLKAAGKINFAVDDEKQEANRFIVVDIENWFAKNHLNYRRYFSGTK